jgi:hypothetical protein
MIQPLQDALQNALSTIVGYIPQLLIFVQVAKLRGNALT